MKVGDALVLLWDWGSYAAGSSFTVREIRKGGLVFLDADGGLTRLAKGWNSVEMVDYFGVETPTADMAGCFVCGAFNPRGQECSVCVKETKPKILIEEAAAIVSGARRSAYGAPERNFDRIARLWTAHLVNVGKLPEAALTGQPELGITAADVSPLMRLMKEARLAESPDHRDSFVDLIGYTLTGAEVNGVEKIPT